MYGLLNLIILLQHLQDKERDVRNVRVGAGELRMNLLRRSQNLSPAIKIHWNVCW